MMKGTFVYFLAGAVVLWFALHQSGCKKNDSLTGPDQGAKLYSVTATVLNPQGHPEPGALLMLKDPPAQPGQFVATTDTAGNATIQSPAGVQTLLARSGLTLEGTTTVTVQESSSPTNAGVIQLVQSQGIGRVLVVTALAESLETVLRAVGATSFDTTYLDTLRTFANRDSSGLLTYLKQYSIIFSDCAGGLETGPSYAVLSRTYGLYIDNGGTIVGGHCNFYHLRRIWSSSYQNEDYQVNELLDSLRITDGSMSSWLGTGAMPWATSASPAKLSGYDKFTDLPANSTVYGTISWTSPQVAVIVANYRGSGKFIWTNFHGQDIASDANLARIFQYFLLTSANQAPRPFAGFATR